MSLRMLLPVFLLIPALSSPALAVESGTLIGCLDFVEEVCELNNGGDAVAESDCALAGIDGCQEAFGVAAGGGSYDVVDFELVDGAGTVVLDVGGKNVGFSTLAGLQTRADSLAGLALAGKTAGLGGQLTAMEARIKSDLSGLDVDVVVVQLEKAHVVMALDGGSIGTLHVLDAAVTKGATLKVSKGKVGGWSKISDKELRSFADLRARSGKAQMKALFAAQCKEKG